MSQQRMHHGGSRDRREPGDAVPERRDSRLAGVTAVVTEDVAENDFATSAGAAATPDRDIVLICPCLGTASEAWIHRQAVGLSDTLRVFTRRRENVARYPFDDGRVVVMPGRPSIGPVRRRWRAAKRRTGWFNEDPSHPRELNALDRLLDRLDDPVILAHYGSTALQFVDHADRLGVPLFAHFNGFDISRQLRRRWYVNRLRLAIPKFTGMVVVAEYMRRRLIDLGADPGRIAVIPYGAPVVGRPDRATDSAGCRFLTVGRMVAKKRPDLTVRAFLHCRRRHPDVQLTIIGDGPYAGRCRKMIAREAAESSVRWMGWQSNATVRDEMLRHDVYIQHSVTSPDGDMEGWPVSIAEAAGAGLPVIATRHAGIVDQVVSGENGFLVDPLDWWSMADRMIDMVGDPIMRSAMGRASQRRMMRTGVDDQIGELRRFLLGGRPSA